MTHRRAITVGLVLMIALPGATGAFGESQMQSGRDNCQAPAQQQSPNAPRRNGGGERDFSKCGGVIMPPASGDEKIEHRAPETGNTPVIPPSDLPGQQHGHTEPR